MNKSVVVGVSGGVDSAVAAALLREQGYRVNEVHIDFSGGAARERLERHVITPFIDSYLNCETPNPCVICNPVVKYAILAEAADKLGAEYIATGHYTGTVTLDGVTYPRKGNAERDQSYMLYRLPQSILKRCLYPVGDMSKTDVRKKAAELGLASADAPDSMEICFIPDNDYAGFIRSRGRDMPEGDIVDTSGNVLGRHKGLYRYTVGQRRGLGVSSAGRLFVVGLDAITNRVVLGEEELLFKHEIRLRDIVLRSPLAEDEVIDVKVRHGKTVYKATFAGDTVRFVDKAKAAAGQSAVFYRDDIVLGGGIIT